MALRLFRFILFLTPLLAFTQIAMAGPALPQFCLQAPSEMLCEPKKNPARDACEIELKTAKCDDYVKLHPELKTSGKLKTCDALTVCENPEKSDGFLKNCAQPAVTAVWDGFVGIYEILTGNAGIPSEQDLAKQEFFKNCTTPECKRKMLGPFASYFTKEEIEGRKDRPDLNHADVANQNYLQGYSSTVLYRKLLQKLKKDFQSRGMSEKFIEPWSQQEAKLPLSFNELIDKALTSAGINNTACFKPEVVWQMRCYALGTLVDPTIVAGAGFKIAKIAGLAGKEAVALEKLAESSAVAAKAEDAAEALTKTYSRDRQVYIWQNREAGNTKLADPLERELAGEFQNAKVKSQKPIPFLDGVTGGSYVELADGTKGVWKPDSVNGSGMAAEVSAYNIDKHLGLNNVPITVRKDVDGKQGSFQMWVNKTEEAVVDDPANFVFFDYLIGNSDRHKGNYLIVDGRPVAIDNGNAFRPQSGVEDFPRRVDEITKEQKKLESIVEKQRAEVDRAKRAHVGPKQVQKMEADLAKAERLLSEKKSSAAKEISELGVTKDAAEKLKSTSNPEWNKMMDGLTEEERTGFFFRKKMAEDAIKDAEKYFGDEIYKKPGSAVEFKKPRKLGEKDPYLEELVGSGL